MTHLNYAYSILDRRKKKLAEALEEAESKLALWSKRVKLATEKNRFDLLDEALEKKDIYTSNVKSFKTQIEQVSWEIKKLYEKKAPNCEVQNSTLINIVSPKPSIFEIKETENLEKKEILEEIKAIKYSLQTAINSLENLEDKILKSKIISNEENIYDCIIIEPELEDLEGLQELEEFEDLEELSELEILRRQLRELEK